MPQERHPEVQGEDRLSKVPHVSRFSSIKYLPVVQWAGQVLYTTTTEVRFFPGRPQKNTKILDYLIYYAYLCIEFRCDVFMLFVI